MEKIAPPKYVMRILTSLRARGYPTYLVGGCVRDMLMGVHPQDWDLCTGALPEQVLELFPGSVPTGLKHGTVTVRMDSGKAEVTTFRTEGDYADHRHPDSVSFVSDLRSDLSRRDFTMNAVALSGEGLLIDPFGGAEDIRAKLVRCVGQPERRFEEDALRMFRALRFSARLGFTVEAETWAALLRKAPLAAELAPERVRDELEKTLLSPAPELAVRFFSTGLMAAFARPPREGEESFRPLGKLPKKAGVRWAGLCALLLDQGSVDEAGDFLEALRLDKRTVDLACRTVRLLSAPLPAAPVEWRRLLRAEGTDCASWTAACADAFFGGRHARALKAVLRSGDCFSLKRLAVSGEDLLALGLRGPELGRTLERLLEYVIEHPENNRRELLLALAGGGEREDLWTAGKN